MEYKCSICKKSFSDELECIECEVTHVKKLGSKEAKNFFREISAACFYEEMYNNKASPESIKLARSISNLLFKFSSLTGYR